jgi:hypothetical protein
MKQTRIVFNSEGFRQILLSDGCHELVQKTTEEIRDKAAQNYAAVSPNGVDADAGISANTQVGGYGGGRWIGFVSTADQYAAAAETEDKIMTRALS